MSGRIFFFFPTTYHRNLRKNSLFKRCKIHQLIIQSDKAVHIYSTWLTPFTRLVLWRISKRFNCARNGFDRDNSSYNYIIMMIVPPNVYRRMYTINKSSLLYTHIIMWYYGIIIPLLYCAVRLACRPSDSIFHTE